MQHLRYVYMVGISLQYNFEDGKYCKSSREMADLKYF